MATHSCILAWKIPWTEVGYSPWGRKDLDTTQHLSTHALEESASTFLQTLQTLLCSQD